MKMKEKTPDKMLNRFLITGCGRSGTKFLSDMMNRSKKWIVLHEPDSNYFTNEKISQNKVSLQLAAYSRFYHTSHYGEVNSILRLLVQPTVNRNAEGQRTLRHPRDFEVDQKGVILRNPFDLLLSEINRHPMETWDATLNRFGGDLNILDWCVDNKYFVIRFDQMTTDSEYLNKIIRTFGINDVTATEKDVRTKVNDNTEKTHQLSALSSSQMEIAKKICDPFAAKYKL